MKVNIGFWITLYITIINNFRGEMVSTCIKLFFSITTASSSYIIIINNLENASKVIDALVLLHRYIFKG